MSASRPVRGRLAPSPTGFLHLGNAWAFLLAWLACRSKGGSLVLRMEDIDPDRSRPEYADAIIRDLRWLGLDWDGEMPPQSTRSPVYAAHFAKLEEEGLIQSRPGAGSHITAAPAQVEEIRRELFRREVQETVTAMKRMGLGREEAVELLRRLYDEEEER